MNCVITKHCVITTCCVITSNCASSMNHVITTHCVITKSHMDNIVIIKTHVITQTCVVTSKFVNTHSTLGSSRTLSIGRSSLMQESNFQLMNDLHCSSIQPMASEMCIYQQLCLARSCQLWLKLVVSTHKGPHQ